MPTYILRCTSASCPLVCSTVYADRPPTNPTCPDCGAEMRRDYKAEGASVNIANLKQAREAGK